ncbi:MAG: Clostripain family protein [Prevotellaceae bacterium]|jgi:hypothetical protein|nr:Clostripain family protein [Prevotellaceae bacterium]
MKEESIPLAEEVTEQTVFVYMPWATDLLSDSKNNLSDLEKGLQNVEWDGKRVLVFLATSGSEASMFELKSDGSRQTLKNYSHPSYTTREGLMEIFADLQSMAPALRYGLIIGCHGLGWIPVASSRYFGGITPAYQTDITTFSDALESLGLKMEYILFDDCYMSTIEVAYELRHITDYLIASPTEIMRYGFPYAAIGRYLIGTVNYPAICREFLSFYEHYSTPCGTIGIADCRQLDALIPIMQEINKRYTLPGELLGALQRLDGYNPPIFFDLADYVAHLCDDPLLLADFQRQIDRIIPADCRAHTATYYTGLLAKELPIETFSGITISDPSINPRAASVTTTAWYRATHPSTR